MSKIQKLSTCLSYVFNGLLIIFPIWILLQWIFIQWTTCEVSPIINFFGVLEKTVQTPEGMVNLSQVHWTLLLKILGFSADLFGALPMIFSLFILRLIFKNYQKGQIFTPENALHYRKLGWLFVLKALVIKSLSDTLMVLAVTLTNPPGHRYLHIGFGTPNLEALFYGMVVVLISWVMVEASKIHDEQRLTI